MKEMIIEKLMQKAEQLDLLPEELAKVPWPLLEQILFPKNWEEDCAYDYTPEELRADACVDAYMYEGTDTKNFSRVEESNLAYDISYRDYEKKQGEYTLEDYYALPDNVRAELIDGELIYMDAPNLPHQHVLIEIAFELKSYIKEKKGACMVLVAPLDVQLDRDDKTMVQPDIMVSCEKEKRRMKGIYGAPDLAIEVTSPSTRRKDIKRKTAKYKEAGVREYWIVDMQKQIVITYFFEEGPMPNLYSFENDIPVAIFDKECKICFSGIFEQIMDIKD